MDPTINKLLNKSSNRLLNKIRSNLNKPVTREVISDNIIFSDNRSLANTREIIDNYSRKEKQIDFEVSLQNEKIKKDYSVKEYDFSTEPTREEFSQYVDNLRKNNIDPSLREDLARRFRPFFMEIGEKSVRTIYDTETRKYLDAEGQERLNTVRVNERTQRVMPQSAEANQNLLKAFPDERVDRLVDIFNKKLNFSTFFYPNENKIGTVDDYDQPKYLIQSGRESANIYDGPSGAGRELVLVRDSATKYDSAKRLKSEYSSATLNAVNSFFPIDSITLANKPGVLYMDQDPIYLQNRTFNEFLFQEMLNQGLKTPLYEDYLQKNTELDIDGNVISTRTGYNRVGPNAIATARASNIDILPDAAGKKHNIMSTVQHEKTHAMAFGSGSYYNKHAFNLAEPKYDQFLGALLSIDRPGSGEYLSRGLMGSNYKTQEYVNRFPESGALYEEQRFVRGLGPNEAIPAWAQGEAFKGDDNIYMHSKEQGMSKVWNDYLRKEKKGDEKYWTQRDSITKQRQEFYNQIR
jgi:hypothetical protein